MSEQMFDDSHRGDDFDRETRRFTCRECGRNHASCDHAVIAQYFPAHATKLPKYPDGRPEMKRAFAALWEAKYTSADEVDLIRNDERHACWSDVVVVLKNAILDCPAETGGKEALAILLESILGQGWSEMGTGDGKPIYLSRDGEKLEAAAREPRQGESR